MAPRLALLMLAATVAAAAAAGAPCAAAAAARAAPLPPPASLSLSVTSRALTPPDVRGTYIAVFANERAGAPCPRTLSISGGTPVNSTSERVALQFTASDLVADAAPCGAATLVKAVATSDVHRRNVMDRLGMPNGSRAIAASDLIEEYVQWADVVGFNLGSLACGAATSPLDANTLALWGDSPRNVSIGDPAAGEQVKVVRLAAGGRHLLFMARTAPLCILSAKPLPGAAAAPGDGDSGSGGGVSPGMTAAAAAGAVGVAAIAAAVAVWGDRQRRRRRRQGGEGDAAKGEPAMESDTWTGAPPPPPSPLAGRPELFPTPPPPPAAYPTPSSWDDDTRRSSSVPTSAGGAGGRPSSSSTASPRDRSTGSGVQPPSSRGSGSSGGGGGGEGRGRTTPAYSDVSSGQAPGDEATSVTAAAATSPVVVDDLWPTWDSKLSDE